MVDLMSSLGATKVKGFWDVGVWDRFLYVGRQF